MAWNIRDIDCFLIFFKQDCVSENKSITSAKCTSFLRHIFRFTQMEISTVSGLGEDPWNRKEEKYLDILK